MQYMLFIYYRSTVCTQAHRFWPSEPLLLLCIGVSYLGLALTPRVEDRNRAVLLAFAFLQVRRQPLQQRATT